MKKITPVIIVLIMFLATACGSSAPTATQAPATQASSATTGTGTEVDITLADNTIQSSLTTFKVGVPYAFVIKNTGHHTHNFNINQPVSETGSIDTSLSGALFSVKQDQLAPGSGTTVNFTFPDSAAGQSLEFSCLIRQHYEDGMRLAITVTK